MVYNKPVEYLVTLNTKVTALVSSYYLVSNMFPLTGGVELLIHVPIEPESSFTNCPPEL